MDAAPDVAAALVELRDAVAGTALELEVERVAEARADRDRARRRARRAEWRLRVNVEALADEALLEPVAAVVSPHAWFCQALEVARGGAGYRPG